MSRTDCHAILRVTYRADKKAVTYECDSEMHTQTRIKEEQAKPEVIEVGVFYCHHTVRRKETWDEEMYKPKTEAVETKGAPSA